MKRILSTFIFSATFLVLLALPAAADYPPAGTTQKPEVLNVTVHAAPGTAFTGSTVIPLVLLGVALLAAGTVVVYASRRVRNAAGS